LNDKKAFADRCAHYKIAHVPCLVAIERGSVATAPLPSADLFVKPRNGRGGRGAERWDYLGEGFFEGPGAQRLTKEQLIERLTLAAQRGSLLVQPRLTNHRELHDLSSGALSTVRIMTCLDENDSPEVVGAAFRMSIGANRTVDNFHAGGIASAVSKEGKLGPATDAGLNVALGWLTHHPNTGAEIEGRSLPLWAEVQALATRAHRAFADRKLIGWDIAITDAGPIIIEGNSSADLDIIQRTARMGLAESRLAELMAFHIKKRLN
jgi:hypothetical protein